MNRFSPSNLLAIVLLTLVIVVCADSLAQACPTCKNALASDPQQAALVRGYGWSIIFMMSMPFLILGGMGTYFYLLVRKARKSMGEPSLEMILGDVQGWNARSSE